MPPCCAPSRLGGGGDSDNGWQGMLDIEKDTAKRIIDALAVAMEPLANPGRFSTRPYFRSDKWPLEAHVHAATMTRPDDISLALR